jgi:hypothetical protein
MSGIDKSLDFSVFGDNVAANGGVNLLLVWPMELFDVLI